MAGHPPGRLFLLRHGQTAWSASGLHTGLTDIPLTADGERGAAAWAQTDLPTHPFAAVLSSPLIRARRTAELAGLAVTGTDEDLTEWHYGDAEGKTTPQLQQERPGWDIWIDGPPGGESLGEVAARTDRVLRRIEPDLATGDVMLVAHGHLLRVLAARWMGEPAILGARLKLEPATLSELGYEHSRRVIVRWSVGTPVTPSALR